MTNPREQFTSESALTRETLIVEDELRNAHETWRVRKSLRNYSPMRRLRFTLLLSLCLLTAEARAAEDNPGFAENQEITDAVLKASAGSLSRYSLRFNFAYAGPPVGDLSAREQPNPDQTVTVTATGLAGNFGGRFRLSSNSSLSLTAGLSDQYIFHDHEHLDVNNPYLSYDRAFRWHGLQMISSPGIAWITASQLRQVGEVASISYVLSTVFDFGASRFALGLDATFGYYFFNRPWLTEDGKVRRAVLGLNPALKWNANDRLNLYSGLVLSLWNPRADMNALALYSKTTAGKIGAGYAFTRDIYFTPFLGFFPWQSSWETTTINFSTIFSIL